MKSAELKMPWKVVKVGEKAGFVMDGRSFPFSVRVEIFQRVWWNPNTQFSDVEQSPVFLGVTVGGAKVNPRQP
ncbi:MAG: hypothetical protein ABSD57_11335 [Verrucomicrobiota bacterium]|jgi:hypothetical protein